MPDANPTPAVDVEQAARLAFPDGTPNCFPLRRVILLLKSLEEQVGFLEEDAASLHAKFAEELMKNPTMELPECVEYARALRTLGRNIGRTTEDVFALLENVGRQNEMAALDHQARLRDELAEKNTARSAKVRE